MNENLRLTITIVVTIIFVALVTMWAIETFEGAELARTIKGHRLAVRVFVEKYDYEVPVVLSFIGTLLGWAR